MAKLQAVRGMNDVLPADAAAWQFLHETAARVFASYGYQQIRLPLVERTELFKRSIGDVTDIVEKEMYSFEDRGGESLSLRPEGTASCVRAGVQHGLFYNQQQRLWYEGAMFRYERPQAGRYRQFHQLGLEAYGFAGPAIDLEIIALSARLWKALGISGLQLELNSLGTDQARADYRVALVAYLQANEDQLDEDSRKRIVRNPLRVLDSKNPQTQAVLAGAPSILDSLDPESREQFEQLQQGLQALGIEFVVNPRLVRGLDYYSRVVFEWTTTELGAQSAVCAGGRYDGLVQQLGGGEVPAMGFAIGVERLILLLQKQAAAVPARGPQLYLCWQGADAGQQAAKIAEQLRDAYPSLRLVVNAGGGSFKAQMKRADKSGAMVALLLGEQEMAEQQIQVKSLRDSAAQRACAWSDVSDQVGSLLGL